MERISINNNWIFTEQFSDSFMAGNTGGVPVRLPHNCRDLAFNYCDNQDYQMICGYRRTLCVPAEWMNKRVLLTFGAAGHYAQVYLNGQPIYEHHCGYTAFTVELTGNLFEGENTIAVKVDTRETIDQPPFGFVIDYLTYGGLYREAYIDIKDQTFIADAFIRPTQVINGKGRKSSAQWSVIGELAIAGKDKLPSNAQIKAVLTDENGIEVQSAQWPVNQLAAFSRPLPLSLPVDHSECMKVQFELPVDNPRLWSLNEPDLYTVTVTMLSGDCVIDVFSAVIGFRTAEFRTDGFYLNGSKLKLRGLNHHQCMPYVGYAVTESLQRYDAEILKKELGVNTVRTSHYPQSHHFISECDRLGLVVFTEIPGWQHIGGEEWQDKAVRNVDEMVAQYRNHPSIILWGVRINESQDNDELYKRTNAAAHALDDTRPTSGVRNFERSHLLEDVYSYNDFSYTGKEEVALNRKKKVTSNRKKPYIVSEYNGHMFPTKIYDDEEHCLAHAMRHTNVLKAMYASEDISGCIGWCMFDYNTHLEFGSGDRICYHGVTDMFRNPKIAAAAYASQSDDHTVCEVTSSMLIGEHPGGALGDVYVYTNADSVRLYKNDCFVAEFLPDRSQYPGMPHPPIKIDDLIGCMLEQQEGYDSKTAADIKFCLDDISRNGPSAMSFKTKVKMLRMIAFKGLTMEDGMRLYGKYVGNWGGSAPEYRFEAWKDGKAVASVTKAPPSKVSIAVRVSSQRLTEGDTYDMALVRIVAVDENGNRLNYFNEPVSLEVSGAVDIVGPTLTALRGGAGGTILRTNGALGSGQLRISVPGCSTVTVDFTVNKT